MKKLPIFLLLFFLFWHYQSRETTTIVLPNDASTLEQLAAKEIRRFVYLRTGEFLPISGMVKTGTSSITFAMDKDLSEQEFHLKTEAGNLSILGGSPQALLYGAYEFAEQLGIRFYLHGDVIPDEKIAFSMPEINIRKKPVFDKRGIQPFHDFPEGPDWWNEMDYKAIIGQLAKMKMNFIGFHTYPERDRFNGQGPKAEPLVWIGKEEDIEENGRVKAAYPAMHFHTADSTWGYSSMPTSAFPLGLSQIFETENYGADYMKNISPWPHTKGENKLLFHEVGNIFHEAFNFAKNLGFTTCVGTETPVIIPQNMKRRYGINQVNETVTKDIYLGIFSRIKRTYPIDYYWLWTPESWTWREVTDASVANTEKDILYAREALEEMGNPFKLATCGWVLGPPKDRVQFDRVFNKDIAFSCINRALGYMPIDKGFLQIEGRSKWAIPWMEDDPDLVTAQLWVGRLRKDALDAWQYGCDGLFGIHWRTRIIGPNVSALARAAWECDTWSEEENNQSRDLPTDDFYADWTRTQFGLQDGTLTDLFVSLDSKGTWNADKGQKLDAPLNSTTWNKGPGALWVDGATSERLQRYDFIPSLEAYRKKVKGAGNLERFDYWVNSFKFNRATVETALVYKELDSLMKKYKTIGEEVKLNFMNEQVLPKRIELSHSWAKMINLLLTKVSTNGELGNLANLVMHSMKKLGYLTSFDTEIENAIGRKLSKEAQLPMKYEGNDRLLAFTNPSILQKNDLFHVRVRVLSNATQISGIMKWRKLGEDTYQEISMPQLARNVFEVTKPVSIFGDDFEYYFEFTAGNKLLIYPATAKEINCSVVIM